MYEWFNQIFLSDSLAKENDYFWLLELNLLDWSCGNWWSGLYLLKDGCLYLYLISFRTE